MTGLTVWTNHARNVSFCPPTSQAKPRICTVECRPRPRTKTFLNKGNRILFFAKKQNLILMLLYKSKLMSAKLFAQAFTQQ